MKKRTEINYGRKYAAITLAAVTAVCTGATAGSVVTVAAAEENKTQDYKLLGNLETSIILSDEKLTNLEIIEKSNILQHIFNIFIYSF